MAGFLKLVLTGAVLITFGFCGWWYLVTPQPPGAMAQWHYFHDSMTFQTRHFQKLPNLDFATPSTISQSEADFWLPDAQSGNMVASLLVARYLFAQGEKNPRAYTMALNFIRPAAAEGLPLAQNALSVV